MLVGPRALLERSDHPICEMEYDGLRFGIWFQRSLPNPMARWRYQHSNEMLGGIPDITVFGGGRRLLIDAKRRLVYTKTRSEETYKMLGYLENFRGLFDATPFCGALCFLAESDLFTEMATDRGDRLTIVGAHPDDPGVCALGQRMDTVVSQWLAAITHPT
jgi:hypothetical protein